MNRAKIERLFERTLKATKAPGAALVVVEGDQTEYFCYGTRRIGEEAPVTKETRFGIASVSKAFTAAAVAMAVEDGVMAWDDPVRKHLPAFRLLDPAADSSVTIRDLLCHRTGLPRHDPLWYRSNLSRAEILARMAFLRPSASFRGVYQYSNLCFLVAGEAVAAAVGKPFETYLQERVLTPLGIEVAFSGEGLTARDAVPHRLVGREAVAIEPLRFANVGPAGAIDASVADLGKWIRYQLSESAPHETHRPQMVIPADDQTRRLFPDRIQQSYGLGWLIYDWCGQPALSHAGAIDGFRSYLSLLPRRKSGFALLVNLGDDSLPQVVRGLLTDELLSCPVRPWAKLLKAEEKLARKKPGPKRRRVKPTLSLKQYVGAYSEPGYGRVTIALGESGALQLEWLGNDAPLKHTTRDRFAPDTENLALKDKELFFQIGKDSAVAALTFCDQVFLRG